MSVWEGLVSLAFFVMLVMTVWGWIENRSLRDQLAEQRVARIEQATRAHHLATERDVMKGVAEMAVRDAARSDLSLAVVEEMNRFYVRDIQAREAAAEARRLKAKERKAGK